MNSIIKQPCEELGGIEIRCITFENALWFKAVDVGKILGYKNTRKAIADHVATENKRRIQHIDTSIFINSRGIKQLLSKSQKSESIEFAKSSGIEVETKYLRKEIEIVSFIQEFLTTLNISFEFQKHVLSYKIDLYLPENKIAIEIDEHGHSDRNQDYEQKREQDIVNELGCKFLRFNPDEPNFKISHCIAMLAHNIFRT